MAIVTLLAAELREMHLRAIDTERLSNPSLARHLAVLVGRPLASTSDSIVPDCTGEDSAEEVGNLLRVGGVQTSNDTLVYLSVGHRCWLTLPPKAQRIMKRERIRIGESIRYRFRKVSGNWTVDVYERVDIN